MCWPGLLQEQPSVPFVALAAMTFRSLRITNEKELSKCTISDQYYGDSQSPKVHGKKHAKGDYSITCEQCHKERLFSAPIPKRIQCIMCHTPVTWSGMLMGSISSKDICDNTMDIGLHCSLIYLIVYLCTSVDPRRLCGGGCILLKDG